MTAPAFVRFLQRMNLAPHKCILCLGDMAAIGIAVFVSFALYSIFATPLQSKILLYTLLLLPLMPLTGKIAGLYATISSVPHRELKAAAQSISFMYVLALAVLFFAKSSDTVSRLFLLSSWVLSLFSVPVMRSVLRARFSRLPWWGAALVIFDTGKTGKYVWHWLRRNPNRGMRPVCLLDIPSTSAEATAVAEAVKSKYPHAVAVLPHRPDRSPEGISHFEEISRIFETVLVLPQTDNMKSSHWFAVRELGMTTALLHRSNLNDKRRRLGKRLMDIALTLLGMTVVLPVGIIISIAICINSPGSPVFSQKRIGLDGKHFTVFKFRTMVPNAERLLKEYLDSSPEMRAEWKKDQKLRNDPRIFAVGSFLRKTSLDELPQLINVLKGDMSLVGPRPIVDSEVEKYGSVFSQYCRVRPGITGYWQISGRNDTSYEQRVEMDLYYVSNWSVWLDIWILFKTVPVVLFRKGAY